MKTRLFSLLACGVIGLTVSVCAVFGQEGTDSGQSDSTPRLSFRTNPLEGESPEQALLEGQAGQTIPLWKYQAQGPYGLYTGYIVGRKYDTPSRDGSGVTNVPTYIVPLVVDLVAYVNGRKVLYAEFDPTKQNPRDSCSPNPPPLTLVQNSPLFQDAANVWGGTNVGQTQYIDAQLRGEFWKLLTPLAEPWHNKFQVTTLNAQTLEVPYPYWGLSNVKCNGKQSVVGRIYYFWLDYKLKQLIRTLKNQGTGVGPTSIPLFLTYNVYAWAGGDLGGYHSAYGSPMQVYSMAAFDTSGYFGAASQDITILSHELGEVMNDPTGLNSAPSWGRIGQVKGCQYNFEVGDPLTGTQNPPINLNNYTYHPQELAFFAWFFRSRNIGVNGWYSSNGTLALQTFCR
jgi:hypothetical protein